MSKNHKLLLSVIGTLAAHLLMLVIAVVVLALAGVPGSTSSQAASEPQQVTLLLSDLIPELPDIREDESEVGRPYVRTDHDPAVDAPPDDARFESDNDTLASTQMLPDPSAEAVEDMPTIVGRDDLPSLELRNREFIDGEQLPLPPPSSVDSQAAPAAVGAPAPPTPPSANPESAASPTAASTPPAPPPANSEAEGDDRSETPGRGAVETASDAMAEARTDMDPLVPSDGDAEESLRPEAMRLGEPVDAETEESFSDPLAQEATMSIGRDAGQEDREAAIDRETEKVGATADAAHAAASMAPAPVTTPTEADRPPEPTPPMAATPTAAAADSQASEGAETTQPAFTPQTRANEMSGTLSNLGNKAALDVEATELGRYKKSVNGAIEHSWNQFRLSNLDDVTAGNLRVRFRVDREGTVRNLTILRDEANIGMTEFTLKSILAARIPPMPEGVASVIGAEGLVITYTFLVY